MSTKNTVTFSISCQHVEPETMWMEGKSMNRIVKALETSLLCLMAKCKNHFLFMFHFRTIKFVINASGHVTWKKETFSST